MIYTTLPTGQEVGFTFRHGLKEDGRRYTTAAIELQKGEYLIDIWSATSHTHPSDNFCKETGRKLALARVLRDAGFDRAARTTIWRAYFERGMRTEPAHAG